MDIRLNDIAIRLNDIDIRLNDIDIRLNAKYEQLVEMAEEEWQILHIDSKGQERQANIKHKYRLPTMNDKWKAMIQ